MMDPLISVIVPVYNVEQWLAPCIDSILAQSYNNLEIILIDDGSTDSSGEICDRYENENENVIAIHTCNNGLSAARNMGLDIMRGEYVCFVDSDDILLPDAIRSLFSILSANKADISVGRMLRRPAGNIGHKHQVLRYSPRQAIEDSLYQKRLLNAAWAKLFSKQLFNDIRFTTGILYEDLDLIYKLFDRCKCVVYTTEPVYIYRLRSNSLVTHFNARRLDVLDVVDRIEQYMRQHHPSLIPAARDRVLSANFNMYWLMAANSIDNPEAKKRCWENIRLYRVQSLINPHVRIKNKIGILLSFTGRRVFTFICSHIHRLPGQ